MSPSKDPKSLKRAIVRTSLTLVSATLFTEVALRVILGLGNPVLIQQDPAAGYTLKPNQQVHRFFVNTHINQFGMRSADISAEKPAGTTRVMFLGDSVVYGTTQVDQSQIFSELVRSYLQRNLRSPVEVLNASAAAWAIGNELGYVKSRGLFGSDLLVLVINRGDIAQKFNPVSGVGDSLPQRRPTTAIGELVSRAHLILNGRKQKVDAGILNNPADSEDASANLRLLDEMNNLAHQKHTKFAIAYLPLRLSVQLNQQSSIPKVLADWAKRNEVPTLDLTAAEARFDAPEIETADHIHFNAKGNTALADPLTRFILDRLHSDARVNTQEPTRLHSRSNVLAN